MHEAGRRDPLAIFHEAIERPTHRHQAFRLICPGIGDRPRLDSMRDVLPQRLATLFQPQVEGVLARSEEHTSELQSLMRISYAVFGLKTQRKTQSGRQTQALNGSHEH